MQKKHAKTQTEQTNEETLDFNKPDFTFIPGDYHDWRQQGPYLVCKSCEVTHAVYIGMAKLLTGFNKKGEPIIKKR